MARSADGNDAPHAGVVGGKYRVDEVLGSGAMGLVVRATHAVLGNAFALKLPRSDRPLTAEGKARFLQEARMAARLKGPHVCRVFDVGEGDDGVPFIVMELLEGQTLAEALSGSRPLATEEITRIFVEVCDALAEAHALGIVHRDIKPSNIFLARGRGGERSVRVLDFGIARAIEDDASGGAPPLTAESYVLGTPHYAAPEQLQRTAGVDGRADLWAVGVCLYEALSGGARPFRGATALQVGLSVIQDTPPPLRSLAPSIGEDLAALVHRCLEKDRSRRVASATALGEALGAHALGRRPQAAPADGAAIHSAAEAAPGAARAETHATAAEQGAREGDTHRVLAPTEGMPAVVAPSNAPLDRTEPLEPMDRTLLLGAPAAVAAPRRRGPLVAVALAASLVVVAAGVAASALDRTGSPPEAASATRPALAASTGAGASDSVAPEPPATAIAAATMAPATATSPSGSAGARPEGTASAVAPTAPARARPRRPAPQRAAVRDDIPRER